MFMFQLVAPIAAIGLFFKGQWGAGFSIILGLIFAYGMRFYGLWLLTQAEKRMAGEFYQASDVLDVESDTQSVEEGPEEIENSTETVEEDNGDEDDVIFDK